MTAPFPRTESATRAEIVTREDLVQFLNACQSCTGQREFYSESADAPRVSIAFLHHYILGNYRRLYARTLAAGVNDFNRAQILLNLLSTGRDTQERDREEENTLIRAGLRSLPPHRVWNLLGELRKRGINNRRSRAVVKAYLVDKEPERAVFETVKYRTKVRAALVHAHTPLTGEWGPFLFGWNKGTDKRRFQTPLFESFRRAHFSADDLYELPYTVAEGLAQKHNVPRDVFLRRIAGQMTNHEKLRLQETAEDASKRGVDLGFDLSRAPLTRLVLYLLSLPAAEREEKRDTFEVALRSSARRALRNAPLQLAGHPETNGSPGAKQGCPKIAAVLDRSYSSSGSEERRRRPLAVAVAVHYLLREAYGTNYVPFWTGGPVSDPLLVAARGQTNLADGIVSALEAGAGTLVLVSDGCDNDPPSGAAEVLRVWRTKLDPTRRVSVVHCNPVFSADDYGPLLISEHVPTVGLRDAEDLSTVLGFARFAEGTTSLADLETYLAERVASFVGG